MAGILGFRRGDVTAAEPEQAGLIEGVAQAGLLGELVEGAGLFESIPADPGAPQRSQVTTHAGSLPPSHPKMCSEIPSQRPDIGAR